MRFLLIILLFISHSFLYSQKTEINADDISKISESIYKSDCSLLKQYFSNSIEIITPETEGVFSSTQAEMILKTFFKKYPADSFKVLQNGQSKGDSKFFIGTYTSKDNVFSVYSLVKSENQKDYIIQLHFEKE